MSVETAELADERTQMREYLRQAAARFEVTLIGTPIEGQFLRSLSAHVNSPVGPAWLRVGREHIRWITDAEVGDFWTGISDASATFPDLPLPHVLASEVLGDDPDGRRRVRADLMTRLPGAALSGTDALVRDPGLPMAWWRELRRVIDVVRAHPTKRFAGRAQRSGWRVAEVFGDDVAAAFPVTDWETAHGDLHYANLLGPDLAVLDWELWGTAPAGTDPATLYLYSLATPDVARQVHTQFGDILDSPAGRVAQVHVASRILRRPDESPPSFIDSIRHHIEPILRLEAG